MISRRKKVSLDLVEKSGNILRQSRKKTMVSTLV